MKHTRRVRPKKRTRRGGKKLGEGKYGFVIDPAIPCEGKDTKGYVSKVFKTPENINKELIETIKSIPNYENYFILPEFCENVGELTEENKKDGVTEENKRNGYLMKKAGTITLRERIKEFARPSMYGDLHTEDDLADFIENDLKNVFKGLQLLHEKNILHGDLHTENIIEWGTTDTFRIIDFDRSFFLDDVEKKKAHFKYPTSDSDAKLYEKEDLEREIYELFEVYSGLKKYGGKKKTRRGGKIIGNGEYGFVVDPAIPCSGKDTTGYVSKVFNPNMGDSGATTLLEQAKSNPVFEKIREIEDYDKYFIIPEFCDNIGDLTKENEADGIREKTKHNSYLMKKGGESLEEVFFRKGEELTPIIANEDEIVNKIVEYLRPVVAYVGKGVELLHSKNFAHTDLHPGNVLQMSDGTFRIIDLDQAEVLKNPQRDMEYFLEESVFMFLLKKSDAKLRKRVQRRVVQAFKPDSRPDSRTGGAAPRLGTHTPYRSRKGKGSSRR